MEETNFGDMYTRWDRIGDHIFLRELKKFLGMVVIAGVFTLSLMMVATMISNWKTAQVNAAAAHSFKPVHVWK